MVVVCRCMYKAVGGGMAWHGESKSTFEQTAQPETQPTCSCIAASIPRQAHPESIVDGWSFFFFFDLPCHVFYEKEKESKDNTKPPSATSCAQSDEGVLWAEEERG